MILKNASLNFSLVREVLRRQLWTITLSSITLFLSLPLPVIMTIQNAHTKSNGTSVEINRIIESTTNTIFYILSVENLFTKILIIALAIIAGISVFSYLHSKEKTDFFHSLPISRNKLFATRLIAGILTVLPAFLINYLLSITIASSFGYTSTLTFNIILQTIAANIIFFLVIYVTSALCAILCGNTIISILLFAWISFSPSLCIIWANYLQGSFYKTFVSGSIFSEKLIARLSPIIQFFFITTKKSTATDGFDGVNVFLNTGANLWLWLTAYFAVFIIITLIAVWLNRHRYSEKACGAIAFEKFKSPLKFYMVTITAIGMGLLFREIVNPFWMYIGFFIGGLLCHMIVEITYHFDFKAIFKNIKWFSVYAVIFSIFILGMYFDITGFDRYLPNPDSLNSVNVTMDNYLSYSYNNNEKMPLSDPKSISLVCKIAELGIAQKNDNFDENSNEKYNYVDVKFDKKFGGTKNRRYRIKLDDVSKRIFNELRYSEEYKLKRLPLFSLKENETEVLSFFETKCLDYVTFPTYISSKAQIKEIIASAREEWNLLTPEYLENTAPISLMFAENNKNSLNKDGKYEYKIDFYSDNRIPIYPNFKKTISLIEKYSDFKIKPITIDDVSSVTLIITTVVTDKNQNKTYNSVDKEITNPLDIAVIIQNAIPSNLAYSSDPNFIVNEDIRMNLKLKNSNNQIEAIFPANKVPYDVIERYK